jgi:Tol biopolymer transport system component/DNA-binding winged helix-turn-helix (wHTH) protein
MSLRPEEFYVFGPYRLDPRERQLLRDRTPVSLPAKAFDLLVALVARSGHLVTKEELLKEVWPGTFVEEANLSYTVSLLRKALGGEPDGYIETIPKSGYRFRAATLESARGDSIRTIAAVPHSVQRPVARRFLAVAALVLFVGLAAALWNWHPRPVLPGSPVLTRLTFDPGLQTDPAFSPDGHSIAFASNKAGNFDIWVQPVAGGDAVQVTRHPAHDRQPDWSPDGRRIIFRSERDGGGLFTVPPLGGVEERVSPFGYRPRWSPDGSRFVFVTTIFNVGIGRVYIGTVAGHAPVEASRFMPGGVTNAAVNWHPDGRRLSFLTSEGRLRLETLDLDRNAVVTSEMSKSTRDSLDVTDPPAILSVVQGESFGWNASGRVVFFAGVMNEVYDIWKVAVDPAALTLVGPPTRLTASAEHARRLAVSRDGRRVAYTSMRENSRLWSRHFDSTGRRLTDSAAQPLTPAEMNAFQPRVTTDGRHLLYVLERPGAPAHWREARSRSLQDSSDSFVRRYDAQDAEDSFPPIESADGAHSVFTLVGSNSRSIRTIRTTSGSESPLTSDIPTVGRNLGGLLRACGWSADGRYVVASRRVSDTRTALVLLPTAAAPRAEEQALIVTEMSAPEAYLWCGDGSVVGNWLAFVTVRRAATATTSTVNVVNIRGGRPAQITDDSGRATFPTWSRDGRTLFFIVSRDGVDNVWATGFDPKQGVGLGDAYPLTHFDGTDDELYLVCCHSQIGVTDTGLILPIRRPTGNIWMLEMPPEEEH